MLRPRRPEQGGQTLAEFALVLPVFAMVLFGVLDAGRLVYSSAAVSQAAREGARLAATEAAWVGVPGSACVDDAAAIGSSNPGAHVCPADVSTLKDDISSAANRMAVGLGTLTDVHISCHAGTESDPSPSGDWTEGSGGNGCSDGSGNAIGSAGGLVSVRVSYAYEPFTPIVGSLVGSLELSGAATMTIN